MLDATPKVLPGSDERMSRIPLLLDIGKNGPRQPNGRTAAERIHASKHKVLSVVGARPNFVKLAPVHRALVKRFDHVIVHTGQHYDYALSEVFFQHLNLPDPDYELNVGSGSHGYQLGEMIKKTEEVLLLEKPEIVVVYGDTNSTLAGALAAAKVRIPVAHVEAGLRCFDMTMAEEINRVLTDHVARYLFAPTKTALRNLVREHCSGEMFFTGDVMVETLRENMKGVGRSSQMTDKLDLGSRPYVLATIHRSENTENRNRLANIVEAIRRIGKRVIFPAHPRTIKALTECGLHKVLMSCSNVTLTSPMGFLDFIEVERNANVILTDSGGVQKEAYLLGIPCVTLRERTEWVETVSSGWNRLVGVDVERIVKAVHSFRPRKPRRAVFGTGKASERIADLLCGGLKHCV